MRNNSIDIIWSFIINSDEKMETRDLIYYQNFP
jgi:hypothetical protein